MNIISRQTWGAAPPRGGYRETSWRDQAVLHHTAGEWVDPADGRPGPRWFARRYLSNRRVQQAIRAWRRDDTRVQEKERAAMRAMQRFHQAGNGWTDLGYHYVIFPSGRVYEGRPARTVGAHAVNGNHMPGISCAGNYEHHTVTPQMRDAIRDLMAHLGVRVLIGHYRIPGNSTACPGRNLKTTMGV